MLFPNVPLSFCGVFEEHVVQVVGPIFSDSLRHRMAAVVKDCTTVSCQLARHAFHGLKQLRHCCTYLFLLTGRWAAITVALFPNVFDFTNVSFPLYLSIQIRPLFYFFITFSSPH